MIQLYNQLPAETDIQIELAIDKMQRLFIRADIFHAVRFLEQWCEDHQDEIEQAKKDGIFELTIKR